MTIGSKLASSGRWWLAPLVLTAGLAAGRIDLRLVEAVEKGDHEEVRSLLKQNTDVNAAKADGSTALAWAAHRDDLETSELLIRAKANVNAANDFGVGPLSLACANGSAAMVAKLLTAGADPNASQRNGETVLMTCAGTGNVDAVKALLSRGPKVNAKEARRGQTALMRAVARKHADIARALIERGADVHARSTSGFTPLLFAAQQGDLESVRILLAAGADLNDMSVEYGSALVVASASGHQALAAFLLEKGANPNLADRNGTTALHYCALKGISRLGGLRAELIRSYMSRPNMTELAKTLLAHGANPNLRLAQADLQLPTGNAWIVDAAGATPYLLAAASLDLGLMRLLVAGGADPRLPTNENVTPLMVAAGLGLTRDRADAEERSALEAVKLAVELGSDVNVADAEGQTALHAAAYIGSDGIIQFLAGKGAKVDVEDKYGMTPLSIAEGFIPEDSRLDIDKHPKLAHSATADLLRKLGATPRPGSGSHPLKVQPAIPQR